MEQKKIKYKNYLIILQYNNTPNISIFKAEKDGSFNTHRYPDAFWFSKSKELMAEAVEEIDKYEKLFMNRRKNK